MAARLSTRQKNKQAAAPPREAGMGDNLSAEQKAAEKEEAERVQLISIISRVTAADQAIELARAPLKAAQEDRKKLIGLGKAAGFTAKEIERRIEEMKTPTRKMVSEVLRESKQRRWLGIIDADQSDLLSGTAAPQEAKDEAHWKGEGYKAGLRMLEAKPPTEMEPRFTQAWMAEHERGFNEAALANAPKAPPKPVAQQAREDFDADNPDHVAKAARKLKGSRFMDTTAPPEEGVEPTLDTPPADGFEATEEELAKQTTRLAVVGGRDEDEPVV